MTDLPLKILCYLSISGNVLKLVAYMAQKIYIRMLLPLVPPHLRWIGNRRVGAAKRARAGERVHRLVSMF